MKMKRLTMSGKQNLYGYLLISPFIIGFIFLFLKPLIQTIQFSFNKIVINPKGFTLSGMGFEYYSRVIVVDTTFKRSLVESMGDLLLEIPLIIFFSLFIANILNEKFKGRIIARTVLFLPVIITSGILVRYSAPFRVDALIDAGFGKEGSYTGNLIDEITLQTIVTGFFSELQVNFGIASSSRVISFIVRAINEIFSTIEKSGVQILVFLAAIQSIPHSIYESAKIEGATRWDNYWLITFPMISPFILTNAVYTIVDSFTRIDNSVMMYISDNSKKNIEAISYGSAMSVIYCLVILVILFITWIICRKWIQYYES